MAAGVRSKSRTRGECKPSSTGDAEPDVRQRPQGRDGIAHPGVNVAAELVDVSVSRIRSALPVTISNVCVDADAIIAKTSTTMS
jgi:hypothetical protein